MSLREHTGVVLFSLRLGDRAFMGNLDPSAVPECPDFVEACRHAIRALPLLRDVDHVEGSMVFFTEDGFILGRERLRC